MLLPIPTRNSTMKSEKISCAAQPNQKNIKYNLTVGNVYAFSLDVPYHYPARDMYMDFGIGCENLSVFPWFVPTASHVNSTSLSRKIR